MSLPPLVCFSGSAAPLETALAWLGCGAHLAEDGLRVLLVEVDPTGTLGRLVPPFADIHLTGPSLCDVLVDPQTRATPVDVLAPFRTLFGVDLPRSALALLPALRPLDAPRAPNLEGVKPEDKDHWQRIGRALCGIQHEGLSFDLVLALLPPGDTALGRGLTAWCADAVVQLLPKGLFEFDGTLVHHARKVGAREIAGLEVRVGEEDTNGRLVHPTATDLRGEGNALHLARKPVQRAQRRIAGRVRKVLAEHPKELRLRFRQEIVRRHVVEAQEVFAALWQADRNEALELFDQEIAPRAGGLIAAMAALRAVRGLPRHSVWELRHVAGLTLQKLRWSDPTVVAEEIFDAYEELVRAAEEGAELVAPARLLIDCADALAHAGNWRRRRGDGPDEIQSCGKQVRALLERAFGMELRPADYGRWAVTSANYARLSGSGALLLQACECLDYMSEKLPDHHNRQASTVMMWYALVTDDEDLWREVIDLCDRMPEHHIAHACYRKAIAYAHLGERAEAFLCLVDAGQHDPELALNALADPDLKPLWQDAGDPDYFARTPPRPA
ncbi:MAG: hypothetical protein H6739_09395 [Alphaproteobacteria bacterium]|nr:hypothetical protein [Alphaproteobacteria bacterium]